MASACAQELPWPLLSFVLHCHVPRLALGSALSSADIKVIGTSVFVAAGDGQSSTRCVPAASCAITGDARGRQLSYRLAVARCAVGR